MANSSLMLKLCFFFAGICVLGTRATRWQMTFTPPTNCPHRDEVTHVCSTLHNITFQQRFIVCCHMGDDGEWKIGEEPEEEDDEEETGMAENHDSCETKCFVRRNVTSYICITDCCEGYKRSLNGTCQTKETQAVCENGGTLNTIFGFSYCSCRPGFAGKTCEKPMCFCQNGGSCVVKDSQPVCECPTGYAGKYCEQSTTCSLNCHNGGKCVSDGRREMCNCTRPYVGKFCETRHYDSPQCPAVHSAWDPNQDCRFYCHSDDQCYGKSVCCRDGCSLFCKHPKSAMCEKDGRSFALGQSYSPNACTNCTCVEPGNMTCTNITRCPTPRCVAGSTLVRKPGHCCPVCSDPPMEEMNIKCPRYPITIEIGRNPVMLTKENTHVTAFNSMRKSLPVSFEPSWLKHCACSESRNHYYTVTAYTWDNEGGKAKCQLDVHIRDMEPPVITSCPENVYVREGERVDWEEPAMHDNVGIRGRTCTKRLKGRLLAAGKYSVVYQAWDFDMNVAICRFNVTVSDADIPFDQLPEGHRQRARPESEEFKYAVVVGPVLGAVGLFVLILALVLCLRMKRLKAQTGRGTSGYPRQNYDNNIYHVPTDVTVKPPPYSLPLNPPEYSSTDDLKEKEYTYIAPPTYTESVNKQAENYTNPGYETLGTKSEI